MNQTKGDRGMEHVALGDFGFNQSTHHGQGSLRFSESHAVAELIFANMKFTLACVSVCCGFTSPLCRRAKKAKKKLRDGPGWGVNGGSRAPGPGKVN